MGETHVSARPNRTGEVWEHADGNLYLVLQDDTRWGIKPGSRLDGYLSLILVSVSWSYDEGGLDWIPDTCFASPKWRRVA